MIDLKAMIKEALNHMISGKLLVRQGFDKSKIEATLREFY